MPSDATRPASSGRQYLGSSRPKFTTAAYPSVATSRNWASVGWPAVPTRSSMRTKLLMSVTPTATNDSASATGPPPRRLRLGLLGAGPHAGDDDLGDVRADAHGDERRLERAEDLGGAALPALVEAHHPVDGGVRHGLAVRRRLHLGRAG